MGRKIKLLTDEWQGTTPKISVRQTRRTNQSFVNKASTQRLDATNI